VELTTTDCPSCIVDTDSVLCMIEDFFFSRQPTGASEPTGHHSTSVTVSALNFVCANINLLNYFLLNEEKL